MYGISWKIVKGLLAMAVILLLSSCNGVKYALLSLISTRYEILDQLNRHKKVYWDRSTHMDPAYHELIMHNDSMWITMYVECMTPATHNDFKATSYNVTTAFTTRRINDSKWVINPVCDTDSLIFSDLAVSSLKSDSIGFIKIICPSLNTYIKILMDTDIGPLESEYTSGQEIIIKSDSNPKIIHYITIVPYSYKPGPYYNGSTCSSLLITRNVDLDVSAYPVITMPNLNAENIFKIAIPEIYVYLSDRGDLYVGGIDIFNYHPKSK